MFDKLAAKLAHRTHRTSVEEMEEEESPMMEVMLNMDKHPSPVLPLPPEGLQTLQVIDLLCLTNNYIMHVVSHCTFLRLHIAIIIYIQCIYISDTFSWLTFLA